MYHLFSLWNVLVFHWHPLLHHWCVADPEHLDRELIATRALYLDVLDLEERLQHRQFIPGAMYANRLGSRFHNPINRQQTLGVRESLLSHNEVCYLPGCGIDDDIRRLSARAIGTLDIGMYWDDDHFHILLVLSVHSCQSFSQRSITLGQRHVLNVM